MRRCLLAKPVTLHGGLESAARASQLAGIQPGIAEHESTSVSKDNSLSALAEARHYWRAGSGEGTLRRGARQQAERDKLECGEIHDTALD